MSAIAVRKGQPVRADLFSLEAMKMETAVSSPGAAVSDVLVIVGASVEAGDLLMSLE